ncbi:MAG TPA: hypothetical protein VN085_06565 [Vicinamibacterales bacterium]|nr:hypothetical protein [Vicinamibacterales bacterium]
MTVRARIALAGVLVACSLVTGAYAPDAARADVNWTNACSGDPNPATCERLTYIADDQADRDHRDDLMWQGVWALVGLTFVVSIAPRWFAAWSWESKV